MKSGGLRRVLPLVALVLCSCGEDGGGTACRPQCDRMQCGPDGCGGSCGECESATICAQGVCVPTSECVCGSAQCGTNRCGVLCGTCLSGMVCNESKMACEEPCEPDCLGKSCGSDGCGGVCGECSGQERCDEDLRQCVCVPMCERRNCGSDGCGGVCGECEGDLSCDTGRGLCVDGNGCAPFCTGRVCGSNGCGGECGKCGEANTCNASTGQCMPWRVSGKLLLETYGVSYGGMSNPKLDTVVDIAGADIPITLMDAAGNVIGTATTGADGSFNFSLPRLPAGSDWLSIIPVWYANREVKFGVFEANTNNKPYEIWNWSIKLSNYVTSDDPGAMNEVRIRMSQGSGALFIYQHLRRAFEALETHQYGIDMKRLPSIGVAWKPGITWPSYPGTCYLNQALTTSNLERLMSYGGEKMDTTMLVFAGEGDESAWGYPTILHEFGHYILKQRRDDTGGGTHYINLPSDPLLAWSEGFATLFSLMAMSWEAGAARTRYWRVIPSGSYWLDYARLFEETGKGSLMVVKPSMEKGMDQEIPEAWVTHVLWNLFDGGEIEDPSEPADGVALDSEGIFAGIGSERYTLCSKSAYNPSTRSKLKKANFVDFVDSVVCIAQRGGREAEASAIMDLVIGAQFPYDRSPVCPE